MKKNLMIIFAAILMLLNGCSSYDDQRILSEIEAAKQELAQLEARASELSRQIGVLSTLATSEFITTIGTDKDGNYVITWKKGDQTGTVTVAVASDIETMPIIAAREDTDGVLYWAQTTDNGKTYTWILSDGKKIPVGGETPVIGIDAYGYWTVNGVRMTGPDGQGVLASDMSNFLFRNVEVDADGMAVFTLADGTVFKIQIYEALSLSFDCPPMVSVASRAVPSVIPYTIGGSNASKAIIDCFTAYNVNVEINKLDKTVIVTLAEDAEEGNCVMMATDGEHIVLKPIFFSYGAAIIEQPIWSNEYGTGTVLTLPGEKTEVEIKVSANISYEVEQDEASKAWFHDITTKADMVETTYKYEADYYENQSGADRVGTIKFSNSLYNVSVEMTVRQSPVVPQSSEPGIATGADLVQFAKAVNSGASTASWQNTSGEVILLNDIDVSGLTEWTPIGAAKSTGNNSYTNLENPFTGVFNGQGHAIKGIKWSFDISTNDTHIFGLFGALQGAVVKNLVLGAEGDEITLNGLASNVVSAGALAGYAESSTIENVTNYVSMTLAGDDPEAVLMCMGGICGTIKGTVMGGSDKEKAVINWGNVATGKISNLKNGGTGMNVGGVAAFMNSGKSLLSWCYNYGNVSAPAGRGGGLVGSFGGSTTDEDGNVVSNCYNYGTIQDDIVGQFGGAKDKYDVKRMGGLVGGTVTSDNQRIEYSYNYGNVFSQVGCRAGGFAGHSQVKIVGCVNKGIILSNITLDDSGSATAGPGWACGYSGKKKVTQCAKGGKVGEWDTWKDNPEGAPDATDDNALGYKNSTYYDPSLNN